MAQAVGCSTWQARSGTAGDDEIHSAVRDAEGNIYLGGFENGILGVENDWPVGDAKGFVEKRTSDGALLWRQHFDTGGIDTVEALAVDSLRHRIVVAGRTSGAIAATNAGQFDLFIAQLDDTSGGIRAIAQFGDIYPEHPRAVTISANGDIVVAGSDDAYVLGNAVEGQPTSFVARFSSNDQMPGDLEQRWWLQPNRPGHLTANSSAYGVASLHDGSDDVVVATHSSNSHIGARVTRLDAAGAVVWDRQLSPFPLDIVYSVVVSGAGNLYVAGTTVIPLAGNALGDSDGFLMELDAGSGDVLWGNQFGSAEPDWVASLAVGDDGRLYIAGNTNGAVAPGSATTASVYALAFSADGVLQDAWQSAVSSPMDFLDSLTIVPTCEGAALLAGNMTGELPGVASLGKNDAVILPAPLRPLTDEIFKSSFDAG